MRPVTLLMSLLPTLVGPLAFAADVYEKSSGLAVVRPAARPPWTGCYFGINVGYGWSRPEIETLGASTSWASQGVVGGGQLGCDYQLIGTGLVFGIRDMFSMTGLNNSATIVGGALGGNVAESNMKWVNTLTGRIGYALPAGLFYVQGGGAWSRFDVDILSPGGSIVGQIANNKGGYDLGIGWEYKSAPNWSIFAEYNYMNFDSTSATVAGASVNIKKDFQNVVVGINWRL
jgi:outer membrane immunogenic protein